MIKAIQLLSAFLYLGVTVSSAAPEREFYFGSWAAGGEAAMSIIGDMQITSAYIKWSGSRSSPKCRTTYKVIERTNGSHPYPDEGWPSSAVASDATYRTVKVRLGNAKCLGSIGYFRFAATSDSDHLDVVGYNNLEQPDGWFGFYRIE